MKVLALIGSPRKNGNTDIMADEVLRGASDAGSCIGKIYLDDYNVRPIAEVCDNCVCQAKSTANVRVKVQQ